MSGFIDKKSKFNLNSISILHGWRSEMSRNDLHRVEGVSNVRVVYFIYPQFRFVDRKENVYLNSKMKCTYIRPFRVPWFKLSMFYEQFVAICLLKDASSIWKGIHEFP